MKVPVKSGTGFELCRRMSSYPPVIESYQLSRRLSLRTLRKGSGVPVIELCRPRQSMIGAVLLSALRVSKRLEAATRGLHASRWAPLIIVLMGSYRKQRAACEAVDRHFVACWGPP